MQTLKPVPLRPSSAGPNAGALSCGRAGFGRLQRGMSLVELMVGVTIGLFIVSAATFLAGNQLTDNRKLVLETQLQQDLRATMDIITRQIRRAGARRGDDSRFLLATDAGVSGLFDADYVDITVPNAKNSITFDFYLDLESQTLLDLPNITNWGFEAPGDGRLLSKLGKGGWQELTDSSTMKVTNFRIEPLARNSAVVPCAKLCPDGTRDCWPRAQVRSYQVLLEAVSLNDAAVKRSLRTDVRVRNNLPVFANATTQACP
jgi:prepilin-type N-terminal cleavage/methylation domain-containing protein